MNRTVFGLLVTGVLSGCRAVPVAVPVEKVGDFLDCRPVSVTTRVERLRREYTFNLVTLRALDGSEHVVVFENERNLRQAVRHIISGPQVEGRAFTDTEVAALSSGVVPGRIRFTIPRSDPQLCLGMASVPVGEWRTPAYFKALRARALVTYPIGMTYKIPQGGFKQGYSPTCEDVAALLQCDLFLERDDYSGRVIITMK